MDGGLRRRAKSRHSKRRNTRAEVKIKCDLKRRSSGDECVRPTHHLDGISSMSACGKETTFPDCCWGSSSQLHINNSISLVKTRSHDFYQPQSSVSVRPNHTNPNPPYSPFLFYSLVFPFAASAASALFIIPSDNSFHTHPFLTFPNASSRIKNSPTGRKWYHFLYLFATVVSLT
jgi:hypothetical protein